MQILDFSPVLQRLMGVSSVPGVTILGNSLQDSLLAGNPSREGDHLHCCPSHPVRSLSIAADSLPKGVFLQLVSEAAAQEVGAKGASSRAMASEGGLGRHGRHPRTGVPCMLCAGEKASSLQLRIFVQLPAVAGMGSSSSKA